MAWCEVEPLRSELALSGVRARARAERLERGKDRSSGSRSSSVPCAAGLGAWGSWVWK